MEPKAPTITSPLPMQKVPQDLLLDGRLLFLMFTLLVVTARQAAPQEVEVVIDAAHRLFAVRWLTPVGESGLDLGVVSREDGVRLFVRPQAGPLLPPTAFTPVKRVELSDTIILSIDREELPYDLDGRLASGDAVRSVAFPIEQETARVLGVLCASGMHDGAAAGDGGETLEEKAERLCPGGNCGDFLRDSIEQLQRVLRAIGHDAAADKLESFDVYDRYCVDVEREVTTPGECQVLYYSSPLGSKLYIAPENLCKPNAAGRIAAHAALYALVTRYGYDVELAGLLLLIGISIDDQSDRHRQRAKAAMKRLSKIFRSASRGVPLPLACIPESMEAVYCYDPENPNESVRRLREKLESMEDLGESFDNLSEEEQEAAVRAILGHLRTIQILAETGQWAALAASYGLSRECVDVPLGKWIADIENLVAEEAADVFPDDLDDDGLSDIAHARVTADGVGGVAFQRGAGDGSFTSSGFVEVPGGVHRLRSGDLDGDSLPDLVVAGPDGLIHSLLRSGPALSDYSLATVEVEAQAVDLALSGTRPDQTLDLLVADGAAQRIHVLLGAGDGTFEPTLQPDGDGFLPAGLALRGMAVADLNRDGFPDVLAYADGLLDPALPGTLLVFLGRWDGVAYLGGPVAEYSFDASIDDIAVADLDDDGALDVVVSLPAVDRVARLRGDGEGELAIEEPIFVVEPGVLVVDDLDDSGLPDIVAAQRAGSTVAVIIDPGLEESPTPGYHPTGEGPSALGLADIDGDGDLDVVTACPKSSEITFLRNASAGPPVDCDEDGTLDTCRLAVDQRRDCDGDATLDTCEIAAEPMLDVDGNGVLDACESRFLLIEPSLLQTFVPGSGEQTVVIPLVLEQRPPDGTPLYPIEGLALSYACDPDAIVPMAIQLAPAFEALVESDGVHVETIVEESGFRLEIAIDPDVTELPPDLLEPVFEVAQILLRAREGAEKPDGLVTQLWLNDAGSSRAPAPPPFFVDSGGGRSPIAADDILIALRPVSEGAAFRRGDADGSGFVELTDGVRVLGFLFLGDAPLSCADAGDTNDDGELELTDAISIFVWLFLGGPSPVSPGPLLCGPDVGDDSLPSCVDDTCS